MREERIYESAGLTWEEFCTNHLRVSRALADRLIQRLEEFGAGYFRLAEIMRISPQTYRALEPVITDEHIELDGELVPITPENAARIRRGVDALRARLKSAHRIRPTLTSISDLQLLLDAGFNGIRRLSYGNNDALTTASITGLIGYARNQLDKLCRDLAIR
jgi:hypothetical protein